MLREAAAAGLRLAARLVLLLAAAAARATVAACSARFSAQECDGVSHGCSTWPSEGVHIDAKHPSVWRSDARFLTGQCKQTARQARAIIAAVVKMLPTMPAHNSTIGGKTHLRWASLPLCPCSRCVPYHHGRRCCGRPGRQTASLTSWTPRSCPTHPQAQMLLC